MKYAIVALRTDQEDVSRQVFGRFFGLENEEAVLGAIARHLLDSGEADSEGGADELVRLLAVREDLPHGFALTLPPDLEYIVTEVE